MISTSPLSSPLTFLRRQLERLGEKIEFHCDPCDRTSSPVHEIAIVAIVKNEARNLEEWIEFHDVVGVSHFYIYDNGSTDDTAAVLAPYVRRGLVTYQPWPDFSSWNGQCAAYAHAVQCYRQLVRWMVFLDADEFMFPRSGSLQAALSNHAGCASIRLPWRCFGHSGHRRRPPGLVIENFTERCASADPAVRKVKSIVDPCKVETIHVHAAVVAGDAVNIADDILLNHYVLKSEEDFEAKLRRGYRYKGSGTSQRRRRRLEHLRDLVESDTTEDLEIARYVQKVKHNIWLKSRPKPVLLAAAGA